MERVVALALAFVSISMLISLELEALGRVYCDVNRADQTRAERKRTEQSMNQFVYIRYPLILFHSPLLLSSPLLFVIRMCKIKSKQKKEAHSTSASYSYNYTMTILYYLLVRITHTLSLCLFLFSHKSVIERGSKTEAKAMQKRM